MIALGLSLFTGRRGGIALALLVILLGGLGLHRAGYRAGHADAVAQAEATRLALQDDLRARGADLSEALAALAAIRAARFPEIERLENEAISDGGASGAALSAGSVRRLRARWGAD